MDTILFITDIHADSRIPEFAGIREGALACGYHAEEIETERLKQPLRDAVAYWNPSGLIVEESSNLRLAPEDAAGVPVVHLDPCGETAGSPGAFIVENGDGAIAGMAYRELCRTDAESFAFVGAGPGVRWSRRRQERFVELVSTSRRDCRVFDEPWEFGNKNELMKRLGPFVESLRMPCAVFAANDATAAAVLDICHALGLSVPGDVSVAGVDDDPAVCDNLHPTLTSVRPDFKLGGRLAAEMLARLVADPGRAPERAEYPPCGMTCRLSTRRMPVVGKRVLDALDLIRREACSGLKAADVVRAMGVSERQAESLFKRAVSRRITEEISAVRLEHVLEYLSDPHQDIAPVANLCGWESDAYLKRLFKRKFGMTMREWRGSRAGGGE